MTVSIEVRDSRNIPIVFRSSPQDECTSVRRLWSPDRVFRKRHRQAIGAIAVRLLKVHGGDNGIACSRNEHQSEMAIGETIDAAESRGNAKRARRLRGRNLREWPLQ